MNGSKKNIGYGPGTFGLHEALHMAHVMSSLFDRELLDHPAIQSDKDLKARAEEISSGLADFYQAVGRK